MKLFAAVVIFVMISSVFADDPSPGSVALPTSPQDAQPSDQPAQDSHDNSSATASVVKTPQGEPAPQRQSAQHDKGGPQPPGKETNWEMWLSRLSLLVACVSAGFSAFANSIAKRSMNQTEEMARVSERAYLATDRWEIKGDVVMCFVTNVGRMPATLINGSIGHFALVGDSPDPPLPLRQRQEITFKDTNIPAQASFPLKVSNLDLVVQRSIAHPTHAFHAFVHVNYLDGFGRELTLHADMRYDAEIRNFVIDGPRTLIEEDGNKKWDPYS